MIKLSNIQRREDMYALKSKKLLNKLIKECIQKVFGGSLYIIESELKDMFEKSPKLYQQIRQKILRLGNNELRSIAKELDRFNIESIPCTILFKVMQSNKFDIGEEGKE